MRNADFLEPLIVNVLGKDMTFTSRLGIWDNAIKAIIEKPIIGHAKTIATTTFHGLTFSIIFNKKFAFCKTQFIMDKAGDFLKSIGLYELFNKEKVTIKEMIDHDWNYSFINSKIEERRRISIKFIEENIK